jgi:hypothetical protein
MSSAFKRVYSNSQQLPRTQKTISKDRIEWLIDVCGIDPRIAAVDLESIKCKLCCSEEGENWSAEKCDDAEVEYKRFLQLYLRYGPGLYPTPDMYTVWQYHQSEPMNYRNDCMAMFGHLPPDFPVAGLRDQEYQKPAHAGINKTRERYAELFGRPMLMVV